MKSFDPALRASSFSAMNLPDVVMAKLEKLKLTQPTPVQCDAVPAALAGLDLIAVAQTGSGKTLAYALPILTKLLSQPESRALVLSPTRETAEQVHRVFLSLTDKDQLSMTLAATGVPNAQLTKDLKKNPRLIIASPGRLFDQLKENKLLLKGLSILVLDEADRMLEMGFEPQLNFIRGTLRGEWQTMMFAASFAKKAEFTAKEFLNSDAVLIRAQSAERPVQSLTQKVYFLSPSQKERRLLDELRKMKGGVILFAESQENCVTIGRFLEHHEFPSEFVHGNMNPGHRNRVLREFREGRFQILVTTDLLARGLDIEDVKHVINYDMPYKAEDFLHRIGRTARAGREGSAITFVTPTDGRTFRKIKSYLEGAAEETLSSNFEFVDR